MRTKDALDRIREDLKNNFFEFDIHALQRMSERSITVKDVLALINSSAINKPSSMAISIVLGILQAKDLQIRSSRSPVFIKMTEH